MKKKSLVFVSMLMLIFGSILCACTFKKPEVKFSVPQIVFCAHEEKNMNDFVEVKEIEKSKLSYRFSNPELFEVEGSVVRAKENMFGKSIVYATLQNNTLASAQLVIKKPFDAPTNFALSEAAVVTWDGVSAEFDGVIAAASQFKVEGTFVPSEGEAEVKIEKTVSSNSFQLENGKGIYHLTFTTLGQDVFDNSKSVEKTFYVGFMPKLTLENFSWNNGVLSWDVSISSQLNGALYEIFLDGESQQIQTEKTINLSAQLASAVAGKHKIRVLVSDPSTGENKKFSSESEEIEIVKLAKPNPQIANGEIALRTQENVSNFKLTFSSQVGQELVLEKPAGKVDFEGRLAGGLHSLKIVALGNAWSASSQVPASFLFESDAFACNVFKLETPQLAASGEKNVNGVFHASLASTHAVGGLLSVFDGQQQIAEKNILANSPSEKLELSLAETGIHNLTAKLTITSAFNQALNAHVLNSDVGETLCITKVENFEAENAILHEVDKTNNVSVFRFKKLAFASLAENYVFAPTNGTTFAQGADESIDISIENEEVVVTLSDRVENLFVAQGNQLSFAFETSFANNNAFVNSQTEKRLTLLSVPTITSQLNSTNNLLSWNAVENAAKYHLMVYKLTKEEYEAGKGSENFRPSSAPIFDGEVETTQHTLESGEYYHITLWALAENENQFVCNPQKCSATFFVSQKLAAPKVKFGLDETLPNKEGVPGAKGYFLEISAQEQAENFDIVLTDENNNITTMQKNCVGEKTIFVFPQNFEAGIFEVAVVAIATDANLFNSSDSLKFVVERIKPITQEDLNKRLFIYDSLAKQTVCVKAKTADGVRQILLKQQGSGNSSLKAEEASLPFVGSAENTSTYDIVLYGTKLDEATKLYEIENGKVTLDCESSLNFKALKTPTDLQYYDGKLKFVDTNESVQYYVLDMLCNTANPEEKLAVSIRLDETVLAKIGEMEISLGERGTLVGADVLDLKQKEINFSELLKRVKQNPLVAAALAQATQICFSVYAYSAEFAEEILIMPSAYATVLGQDNNTNLQVQTISATNLSFDGENLCWNGVETSAATSAETQYSIFVVGEQIARKTTSSVNCRFDEETLGENILGKTFFVQVSNPHFIGNAQSNRVTIGKLASIKRVSLSSAGKIGFFVENFSNCKEVKVLLNGVQQEVSLTAGKGEIATSADGQLSIQLIGKNNEETSDKTYFMDSNLSTWQLKNLSTIAPNNLEIELSDNIISWQEMAAEAEALEYVLIFKDETGKYFSFKTKENFVDWGTNEALRAQLDVLSAGQIAIGLSAFIAPHAVAENGTIYYALQVNLLSGESEFNHFIYSNEKSIKKLATPTIEKVVFENYEKLIGLAAFEEGKTYFEFVNGNFSETTDLAADVSKTYFLPVQNTKVPQVKVEISGNFGQSASFKVFRNGTNDAIHTFVDVQKNSNGTYALLLDAEDYNLFLQAGNALQFEIFVLNVGADNTGSIPSTSGKLILQRAQNLTSLGFDVTPQNFEKIIEIAFDSTFASQLAGGIVLKITMFNGETSTEIVRNISVSGKVEEVEDEDGVISFGQTKICKNISKLIEQHLPNGGSVKLQAFVNSFSQNDVHILASEEIESVQMEMLKPIAQENISLSESGFSLENVNTAKTEYVVLCGLERFVLNQENNFTFVVPQTWESEFSPYQLKIFATEAGKLSSASTTIAFSLQRIESVQSIFVTRTNNEEDENHNLTSISWTPVAGASGYVLKIFRRIFNETTGQFEKGALAFEFETDATKTSFTLLELFGNNYENLTASREITRVDLIDENEDCKIWLEIVAKGGEGQNNSKPKTVPASIKSNPTTAEAFAVDKFGNLSFAIKPNTNYLYRLVCANSAGQWQRMTQEKINFDGLETNGLPLAVEVVVMGSVQTSSADAEFVLDSISFVDENSMLYKPDSILDVVLDAAAGDYVTFVLPSANADCVFVGVNNKDAISSGQVFEIHPTYLSFGQDNNQFIYAYPIYDLLSQVSAETGLIKLYFWLHQPSTDQEKFLHSDAFEYVLKLSDSTGFVEIVKGKYFEEGKTYYTFNGTSYEVVDTSKKPNSEETYYVFENETYTKATLKGDNVSTFAVFENNENTIGFFVKLVHEDIVSVKFVPVSAMLEEDGKLKLNLTSLIENDVKFASISGKIEVDFARETLEVVDDSALVHVVSTWLSENAQPLVFERLKNVVALSLRYGGLNWVAQDANASKFIVYFFSDLAENTFAQFETTYTSFNASDFAGKDGKYYLAVQAINENNLFVLSSARAFKTDENGDIQTIYKNQIASPLQLKDGKLVIDWKAEGDFFALLNQSGSNVANAKQLANETFTSPFTFNLKDLTSGNIFVRTRFTPLQEGVGIAKTFDVNAMDLLADFVTFGTESGIGDVLAKLEALRTIAEDLADRNTLNAFINAIKNASCGVANTKILFDSIFEKLQMGQYKMEYCLISNNSTLNSGWYAYENQNGENKIFVNPEPAVSVQIASDKQRAINQFKIVFQKTSVWDFVDGQYVQTLAEAYVVKLGTHAYSVHKMTNRWTLTALDEEVNESVTVYECNSSGEVAVGGGYLMFHLNHNNGDSLLGSFEILERDSQEMQIYAVGNNTSISSKSQYFSVTLLSFSNFEVNDGMFVWATYLNQPTTVLVQNSLSGAETWERLAQPYSGTFSLDGFGKGVYSVKFVVEGSVQGNAIFVDSPMYLAEDVLKLGAVSFANLSDASTNGLLGLHLDADTMAYLQRAYSDSNLRQFMIYNDNSTSQSTYVFADSSQGQTVFYEAGTTGMTESDAGFAYKRTEGFAKVFQVRILGTTASLKPKADETKENYFIKHLSCLQAGQEVEGNIALRSAYAQVDASMLDNVLFLRVQDGILQWNAVSGRTDENTHEVVSLANQAQVLYKVVIEKYRRSSTSTGFENTNVEERQVFFTANNFFDMAKLDSTQDDAGQVLLRATVQAFGSFVGQEALSTGSVSLVEGGFAYGNAQLEDGRNALLSNGAVLEGISRLNPVTNLKTENGALKWNFTPNKTVDEANFKNYYSFIVMDDEGKQIEGTFDVLALPNTFEITFKESAGKMKEGTFEVSVFATQGPSNMDVIIKSFPEKLKITKLAAVTAALFDINTDLVSEEEEGLEVLSLEKYFAVSSNAANTLVLMLDGSESEIEFTKQNSKLYILRDELQQDKVPENENFIVVSDNVALEIAFIAKKAGALDSDLSESFVLRRTNWQGYGISWDADLQHFTWNYDLCSFNTSILAENAEVEGEMETLSASTLFSVVQKGSETSIIKILGEEKTFKVPTSAIVQPVFVVEATYYRSWTTTSQEVLTKRTYTTTEKRFQPTIVCANVSISVRIKINNVNLLSQKCEYNDFAKDESGNLLQDENGRPIANSATAIFNLFEGGAGTSENPYLIENEVQLRNIRRRLSKDEMLWQFVEDGETVQEEEFYHFQLVNDIENLQIDGILFNGNFTGVLDAAVYDGAGNVTQMHKISFASQGIEQLQAPVIIGENDSAVFYQIGERALTYNAGSALFESLTSTACIKNLRLSATFGTESVVPIYYHSLMAGLAIKNSGTIENIVLENFENHFYGDLTRTVMSYSGIVSINSGAGLISNCSVETNIEINDNIRDQVISVGAIAYTNYATIENCTSGKTGQIVSVVCQKDSGSVQVAGIAVTNTQSATLIGCTNNFSISVTAAQEQNFITCYMAGVCVLGMGDIRDNSNTGSRVAIKIKTFTEGEIVATRK